MMRSVSTKLPEEEADELQEMVDDLKFAGLIENGKSEFVREAIRERMQRYSDDYEQIEKFKQELDAERAKGR